MRNSLGDNQTENLSENMQKINKELPEIAVRKNSRQILGQDLHCLINERGLSH